MGHKMRDYAEEIKQFYGKTIRFASMEDDILILIMEDKILHIFDDGQSCCESRYMTCDDDLTIHKDSTLTKMEVLYVDDETEEDDEDGGRHEIRFLRVYTSNGSFTVCTHNEHNGYYGGFRLTFEVVDDKGVI